MIGVTVSAGFAAMVVYIIWFMRCRKVDKVAITTDHIRNDSQT